MPAVTVILSVRRESASDLARSALSVSQQLSRDWELRIIHAGVSDIARAAEVLAEFDPRIAGATHLAAALATSTGPIVCFLDSGARYPANYLTAVAAAMADPHVKATVAARVIEHGPRFSHATPAPPGQEPLQSQLAVRRMDASLPLPELLALPNRRELPDVAVVTRFGEPTEPAQQGCSVIVELSQVSPPLSVKPQLLELAAAKLPVVVAVSGPLRAAGPALQRWLRELGLTMVAGDTAGAARRAAVETVNTPVVIFVPAGWEIDSDRLQGLADLLEARNAAAVVPVVLDAGGSVLAAGMIWADEGSLPQPFLQGHPPADIVGRVAAVPSPHPAGLTMRTQDVLLGLADQLAAPWWPIVALARADRQGPVLVDGSSRIAIPRFTPANASGHRLLPTDRVREVLAAAPAEAVTKSREAMAEIGWSVIGVDAVGEQQWRARVSRPIIRTQPVATRRWALKIGAPAGRRGDPWGDVFFADDLAAALRSLGNDVVIDRDGSAGRTSSYLDRVVLNIRGYQVVRRQPGAVNLLWIISHPDDIPIAEMRQFDRVYAASASWPAVVAQRSGVAVQPLLQATNPDRFQPDAAQPDSGPDLLFVGNSRHQFRPIVADCRAAGLRPTVIGRDWEQFLPAADIAAQSVPNADLPAAYRSAGIVLNDHWGDMVSHGFLNNRLFDAVACGARVVTDDVPGLAEVLGDSVVIYRSPADLARLCDPKNRHLFGSEAQRRERAARIAAEHSFLARARRLMSDAAQVPILPG